MAQPTWLEMHNVPRSGLGDVHRLDALHLVHAQHPLARAVRGNLLGDDLRHGDPGHLRELRAEILRQIAHGGEVRRAAPVDPLHQLARAKRLGAEALGDERLEFRARQAEKIDAIAGHCSDAPDGPARIR